MRPLSEEFNGSDYPDLLVGLTAPDDAVVYRMNADQALIATIDFFPPVVDDPFSFGAIAAANAMSDIYAMGGEVLFGLNIAAWREDLPMDLLAQVLRGGAAKMAEGGAVIAGGHTIIDKEPKYGLAVIGTARPDAVLTKSGAHADDQLILTKPIGTGILTTAGKNGVADERQLTEAIAWMVRLNREASRAARASKLTSATDITGYSLLGHAYEMAAGSGCGFELELGSLPVLNGALELAKSSQIPGGTARNRDYLKDKVFLPKGLPDEWEALLFDPQTSGGLLLTVPPEKLKDLLRELDDRKVEHWQVGHVIDGTGIKVV